MPASRKPRSWTAFMIADRLLSGRDPQKGDIGLGVLDALHEGREVRIGWRKPDRADDLAAAVDKPLGEGGLGIVPGNKIADRRIGRLPALLGSPFADRIAFLPQGKRDPHKIRRQPRDRDPRGIGVTNGTLASAVSGVTAAATGDRTTPARGSRGRA